MGSSFEELVAEGVIHEVLARLQSGKEADVYVVRYGTKVCAAKVYKDRDHRSFKNNADYLEGRTVRNTRSQRAMGRKSRFGLGVAEDAWKASEADALYKLHAAGVRVPTPVMFLDGVLLMELVLDPAGAAAPRLIDVQLTERDANLAYHDMLRQLVRMLSCDLIHGDLSPYNVLWTAAGPTIIDFPQTISAAHNSNAERFFLRDARNILGHFASIDRSLNARSSDPGEIWRAYRTRELTPEFVPSGRRFAPRPAPARDDRGREDRAPFPRRNDGPQQQRRSDGPQQQRRNDGPQQQRRSDGPQQQRRSDGPQQQRRSDGQPPRQGRPGQGGEGRHAQPARRANLPTPEVIVRRAPRTESEPSPPPAAPPPTSTPTAPVEEAPRAAGNGRRRRLQR